MSSIFDNPTTFPLLVEFIVKRIIDEQRAGNTNVQVSSQMYDIVLEAWFASISLMGNHSGDTYGEQGYRPRSQNIHFLSAI